VPNDPIPAAVVVSAMSVSDGVAIIAKVSAVSTLSTTADG